MYNKCDIKIVLKNSGIKALKHNIKHTQKATKKACPGGGGKGSLQPLQKAKTTKKQFLVLLRREVQNKGTP